MCEYVAGFKLQLIAILWPLAKTTLSLTTAKKQPPLWKYMEINGV